MFRTKTFLALALACVLAPLNSIAMGNEQIEGEQPGMVQIEGEQRNRDEAAHQRRIEDERAAINQFNAQRNLPRADQPANKPAQPAHNDFWTSLKRKLIKPLAFFCGAAALGGIVYAGNSQSPVYERAGYTLWASLIGGLLGMSYTNTKTDRTYHSPITRRGSLAASLGFAATVASIGGIACKITNGELSGAGIATVAGLVVGHSMYYA